MARRPLNPPKRGWSLTLRPRDWAALEGHLFRDGEEHGAIVLAEVVDGPRGQRLLGVEVLPAVDGVDYVPGTFGHRALTPEFVRDAALQARSRNLAYLAVHNHGGTNDVGFSAVDFASHERGYPALVNITRNVVGAVVCTPNAAAGDLWLPGGSRAELAELVVPGAQLLRLRPHPASIGASADRYDRQTRLFGEAGQACFGELTVAVVGLGGVGSLVVEFLARLGVGRLVLIDDDRAEETNLPRLLASRRRDIGQRKVRLARRNARRANPAIEVETLTVPAQDPRALRRLTRCDWVFLAADSNAARHFVNAVVETRLIPATQMGVQVPIDESGEVGRIHSVYRRMVPGNGCFWCNGLINAAKLATELAPEAEREAAEYVKGEPAAALMSLNAITASRAVTDFMFAVTHLAADDAKTTDMQLEFLRTSVHAPMRQRRDDECGWCGDHDSAGERASVLALLAAASPRSGRNRWTVRFRHGGVPSD